MRRNPVTTGDMGRVADVPSCAVPSGRIVLQGLTKRFDLSTGSLAALDGVDLTVREGDFLCIVGPSGCGKTTLLRILAGLEEPTEGTVTLDIDSRTRPLRSMVFQEQGVFPWMTVLDNAAFGLTVRGVPRDERLRVARGYLETLGLAPFEHAYPRQLSGGMRQRVNLARAFANDPAILLMDEPLASLDEQTKMLVEDDLLRLWEGSQKTVVFITHSLDEAVVLGDRVAVMTARPGRIKALVDVTLPRPRDVLDLRNNSAFLELRRQVWLSLRAEVLSQREGERAG